MSEIDPKTGFPPGIVPGIWKCPECSDDHDPECHNPKHETVLMIRIQLEDLLASDEPSSSDSERARVLTLIRYVRDEVAGDEKAEALSTVLRIQSLVESGRTLEDLLASDEPDT